MFKLFFKKTEVPISNKVKEVETVQLWVVTWYSRYGPYSGDVQKEYEAFTSEEEANTFAESLRNAFKLIRHTNINGVYVEKR